MTQYGTSNTENPHLYSQNHHYIVKEPHGKRPFPPEFDFDMDYVPRAKRRFDKISAGLENFSISNDHPEVMIDSSSSEDDMEAEPMQDYPESTEQLEQSEPLVVEPDDEPAVAKKLKLDERLQDYLAKVKRENAFFLPRRQPIKGNELTIWQPKLLVSPKNDFNMSGRITEIDEEEEKRVNEEIKEKIIEKEGMLDEEDEVQFGDRQNYGIVDLDAATDDLSSNSDIGSSWNSPAPSPPNSQITEIDESRTTPTSLTNGSVTDDEMMDFD